MSLLPLGVFIALRNSPSCLDEEERSADRSTQQQHTPMIRGFHERDSNHDGFLTLDELPPGMRANFLKVDADGDGRISLREHISFLSVRKPKSTKDLPTGLVITKNTRWTFTVLRRSITPNLW